MKINSLMRRIKQDEDLLSESGWNIGDVIAYYANEYGLGNIIHTGMETPFDENSTSIIAAINTLDTSETVLHYYNNYCSERGISMVYPFDMGWGAAIIVSDKKSQINIANKTKTGNYNDDIRAYIGRYVSFWSHQTPASLLLNNNPVFSNTLMLQISLYVLAAIVSGRPVRLFPDMYYQLCNPGKRI